MTTTNPTDAQMKLAREFVARIVEGDSDNPLRVAKANRYYNTENDDTLEVQSALLAIQATEARAQGLVDAMHEIAAGFSEDAPIAMKALATWRRT